MTIVGHHRSSPSYRVRPLCSYEADTQSYFARKTTSSSCLNGARIGIQGEKGLVQLNGVKHLSAVDVVTSDILAVAAGREKLDTAVIFGVVPNS